MGLWITWSAITLLIYTVFNFILHYFKAVSFKKLRATLLILDEQFIKSYILQKLTIIKFIKICAWYVIFSSLIIVYLGSFLIFFSYYLLRLSLMSRWESLGALQIQNPYEHRFLSCILLLPNAYAYYLLILIVDLFSKQSLITYKKLAFSVALRILLGFSPLYVHTLESFLTLNLSSHQDRKIFFEQLLAFYTNIFCYYRGWKIVKLERTYMCVDFTQRTATKGPFE